MAFFRQYPIVPYLFYDKNSSVLVRDTLRRVTISAELKSSTDLQFDYNVEDGQTAEEIADKLYGNADKSYIIYMMNDIRDVYNDWALNQNQMEKLISNKYGDDLYELHHVEDGFGNVVDNDYDRRDRLEVNNLEYETAKNEEKRAILLIKPEFLDIIEEEFKELINT